jgi:aryl-alcohol dehydrogenase-like predicted oxidoreductase
VLPVRRPLHGESPAHAGLSSTARSRAVCSRRQDGAQTTRAGSDPIQEQIYGSPGDADVVDAVMSLAGERSVAPAQIALAWLLHRPGVTAPIVGATKLGHIDDALAAASLELSADELALLDAPYLPHPVI